MSASIGGTVARATEEPKELLVGADAALYRSKAEGRDRVTVDADRGPGERLAKLAACPGDLLLL